MQNNTGELPELDQDYTSLDNILMPQGPKKEGLSESEIEEYESTLKSLQYKLDKRKDSFNKFSAFSECFLSAFTDTKEKAEGAESKNEFARDTYFTFLRMQTGDDFETSRFEELVKKDLEYIKKLAPQFKITEISSCLMDGQSYSCVQNIRFSIYLISRFFAQFFDGFELSVDSKYLTTKIAEFTVTVTHDGESDSDFDFDFAFDPGERKRKIREVIPNEEMNTLMDELTERMSDYYEYVKSVLFEISKTARATKGEKIVRFYMSFPVSGE